LIHYGILLDFLYELYYDARIHEHQVVKCVQLLYLQHTDAILVAVCTVDNIYVLQVEQLDTFYNILKVTTNSDHPSKHFNL
jgi:hypothetical protein